LKPSGDTGGCFPTGRHYPGIAHLIAVKVEGLADEWEATVALDAIPWVSIDTETTGRDAEVDRVIEVGFVYMNGGEVIDRKGWLINPGCPIPEDASKVHGILDADVADKPSFSDLAEEIRDALRGVLPQAYNAQFDRSFLREEFKRAGLLSESDQDLPPALREKVAWVDPLDWAREIHQEHKSRSLGDVCQRLGIELENAHRATDDAEASARVMAAFLGDARVPRPYGAFIKEQRRLARRWEFERVRWR
jgi:DNA polymerase-3 subunit epsilon